MEIWVYHICQAEAEEFVKLPIIMYHSILKEKSGTYIISKDLSKLQQEFQKYTGYVSNTFTYPYGAISK